MSTLEFDGNDINVLYSVYRIVFDPDNKKSWNKIE